MTLVPCAQCLRHIKVDDHACPFCAAATPRVAPRVLPTRRLDRWATFTFAAAVSVAACGDVADDGTNKDDGGTLLTEAGADAGPKDGGGLQSAYGLPPPDGGRDAARDTGPKDDGGLQAAYGLPPDGGNVQPPYGLPPMDAGIFPAYGLPVFDGGND